jgi:mannose-P-dolichol utilization defect protein 1
MIIFLNLKLINKFIIIIYFLMDSHFIECVQKTLTLDIEKECISYLISKGLSIGIVLFSFTSKLPQILYMLKEKNIEGLNDISIFSDILVFLCSCLYSFHMQYPFLSYGESVIILIENIIILFLFWKYQVDQDGDRRNLLFTSLISVFTYFCLKGDFFNETIWYLIYSSTLPLTSISRITQLYSSYKAKSTGPLSAFTFLVNMLGNLARIFTSIKETGDSMLILSFAYSFLLNLAVFIQIIYYNKFYKKKDENVNIEMKKKE